MSLSTGDLDVAPFDLSGPLPIGTTVLEASAGTGKTYTIAGLVTRWVAETPLRLPQLLVVTFTRAATAELRDRVRRRLVDAADHLEAVGDGRAGPSDDPVLSLLADAPPEVVAVRRRRVARALTDIDAATISTIHGFCQHVLDGLGIASDLDRDAELVEDQRDLIEEVVDDLLVTTYLEAGDRPRVTRNELLAVGRAVVANPTTALAPRGNADPAVGLRLHLAQRIRDEVLQRSRRRRQLSYDDLLTRLEHTLRDPDRGGAAREALRSRYHVTLIDEFQDTDPVQWSIVSQAFADEGEGAGTDGRALVLIGDPKQAIYAFRGADVYAYLDASTAAHDRRTLATSWRSDAALLRAFDALLRGASFGDADIPYRQVAHAPGHDAPRLVGAPDDAALRLRVLPRHDELGTYTSLIVADEAREVVARDLAADVVELLGARPQLLQRDQQGRETRRDHLAPRDVAVLVRSNAEASLVQSALQAVGVPGVISGVDSVFLSPAATDWRRLLEALERPASSSRVRALALSCWVGWTGDDVVGASEQDWDRLHEDVHRWAALLRDRGVAAMHRAVLLQRVVQPRLLARTGGERLLADLEHIGELLHGAATAEHLGATTLATWLRERIDEAGDDRQDDRLRRLETDDEAVQILTVHRSKGLEFPVVYCPFLWSSSVEVRGAPVFHDDERRRRIDVGGQDHDDYGANKEAAELEARGEELRLLYVALTRARHQVVTWYAPAGKPEWSGLGRMLLCRDPDGRAEPDRAAPVPTDDEALAAARAIAAACDHGEVSVATVPAQPSAARWRPEAGDRPPLDRARFTRGIDESWRRTSYSALTRLDDGEPRVGSEPDEATLDDEPHAPGVPATAPRDGDDELRAVPLPLGDMPGGVDVGTFVHHVLEHTDFAAADLARALHDAVRDQLQRRRLDLDESQVVAGLRAAIETPLGPTAGGLRLRDLGAGDRRDEVAFELPLDRRDTGRAATVADIAALLRAHLPADDPLAGYPDRLPRALLHRDLRGYLGGSIDLVLRRPGPDGTPVFHLADHKTNKLAPRGEALTAWHYRPTALAEGMAHGHYPIQALLYAVALHRTLRWRLPGYDPAVHLGSVLYLFVRGMAGADTPVVDGQPCGVFAWSLPPSLVEATSDLLHGAAR